MATSTHKHTIKPNSKALKADTPAPPRDPAELAAMIAVDGVPQFNAVSLDKRYVPARLPTGRVIEVWGDALMRTPEGEVHPLRAGDDIHKGDVILTAQNGIVQMEMDGSRSARLPFGSDLQGPLAQVNATDQFDAPSAGPGDPGSLSDGLRVERINEVVTAQAFSFAGAEGGGPGLGEITPNGVVDAGNQRPVVDVQNIVVPESGIIVAAGVQPTAVTGLPGFAVFTIHLDSPAVDPVTLGLKLTAGTATLGNAAQGGDFGSTGKFQGIEVSTDDGATWVASDQVAVPAGATQALVRVPITNDTLDEFNETFTLTAQSLPGSTQNVNVTAQATIIDDDPSPTASITNSTVNEGDGHATFTVTLSAVSGKPISVDWATADNTAKAGQDYTAAAGTLTFAPGETTKTFTVDIINDKLVEPTETFFVNLSNGVNVNSDPVVTALPQAIGTIIDNDHAPVLVPQTPAAVNEDTTQTGNVLTGATDADGDPITVVDFTVGGTTVPAGTQTTLPGIGTFVINPDGSYSFTPAPNYDKGVPPVTFHATDGANVVGGQIQLTITPVNDPPVVGQGTANVSELGLVSAQAAIAHPTSTTGQISVSDVDSTSLTAHLIAPTAAVTSGGQTVSWTGAGTVADPLHGSIDGQAIMNASIDNAGNYKVDLLAPLDNRIVNTVDFGVAVSDGQLTTLSTLAVNVQNDTPSFDTTPHTATASLVDTNLLIVLDTSSSMSIPDGIGGLTRLQSAVQSIGALLDKYELNGNVAVRLVTFSTDAAEVGSTWLSVQGAKDALATIKAAGNTNYDAALTVAEAAFQTPGAHAGGQNVTYFFSDGKPTDPAASIGINATEEASWTSFLSSNSMRAIAVGLGTDPTAGNLDPIAYDGFHNVNTSANLVASFDQLNSVLAGTVVAPLTGFLAGASAQAVGGADGGYISHVSIDGIDYSFAALQPLATITPSAPGSTFTYDPNTHVLQVTTRQGGSFSVDMDDGSYGYAPPKGAASAQAEIIHFTVGDHDGDSLSSTLTINVSGATPASATVAPASVHAAVTAQSASTSDPTTTDTSTAAGNATTLHASPLSDVFSWTLSDAGRPGAPGTTHVVGFDGQAASRGGDVLNLHDLLQGEVAGAHGTVGNLGNYLDFSVVGSGSQATTTVQVSSHGGFAAGQASAAAVDQVIVLDHLDIRGALGLDGHAANQQIIEAMLQQGKLVVDGSNA